MIALLPKVAGGTALRGFAVSYPFIVRSSPMAVSGWRVQSGRLNGGAVFFPDLFGSMTFSSINDLGVFSSGCDILPSLHLIYGFL